MARAIITRRIAPVLALYNFTSWTFTNAGATGRTGPTLQEVQTAYSSESWTQNTQFLNMTTQGIQEWTVPEDGIYEIEAWGAPGGRVNSSSFNKVNPGGARIRGNVSLVKGQVLRILVGQAGQTSNSWAGGGGGTFVTTEANAPIIIAGGGGGNGWQRIDWAGVNIRGNMAPQANYASFDTSNNIHGFRGTEGNGAQACTNFSLTAGNGSTGAGLRGNGQGPSEIQANASSFINGGIGALGTNNGFGGFGGGGTGSTIESSIQGGGGGGGYSGGGNGQRRRSPFGANTCSTSTNTGTSGGGGGSFISNQVQNPATSNGQWSSSGVASGDLVYTGSVSNLNAYNTSGHGRVTITKL
jgi:hypothetical protein